MNEIMGPVKIAWSGVGDVYQVEDANDNFITADQINALLSERDELEEKLTTAQVVAINREAELDSLMAIARAVKEIPTPLWRGNTIWEVRGEQAWDIHDKISAHEQKYGPIGGE